MPDPKFIVSAFGDEIAPDLQTKLAVLASEGIRHLELRSAWGHSVLELDAAQLARARQLLRDHNFGVSTIGSLIGKSSLDQPRYFELERLERAMSIAHALDT